MSHMRIHAFTTPGYQGYGGDGAYWCESVVLRRVRVYTQYMFCA